jgi:broad specificity phosphatase PhoE
VTRGNTRIYLIRHGETEFNRLGVFRGRFEVDLNDVGLKQAGETGRALVGQGIDCILSSPLRRAVVTAQVVSGILGVEYEIEEAFNNIDLGSWQGIPENKVEEDYPEEWKKWTTEPERLVVPGGESVEDVKDRASARLREIVEAREGVFALVTHRSVIKVLAAFMLDVPPPYFWKFYIDNAAYSVFEHSESGFTLVNWNRSSHLSEKVKEVF